MPYIRLVTKQYGVIWIVLVNSGVQTKCYRKLSSSVRAHVQDRSSPLLPLDTVTEGTLG